MKKRENMGLPVSEMRHEPLSRPLSPSRGGSHLLPVGVDLVARNGPLSAVSHDPIVGADSGFDHAELADELSDLYRTLLDRVILADNEQVLADLARTDRAIGNK